MTTDIFIGIDLGGTKIEGIALAARPGDAKPNVELARRRVPTPRGDYDANLAAIAALVAGIEAEAGARGPVGIGIPGSLSPATGRVRNANSTWLNGRPFAEDIAQRLGRPVRIANDANCFALSEASDGAAAGAGVVFGVILGTGVGGGLVVNGRVLAGVNGIAGEWGHTPLPGMTAGEAAIPPCWCGRHGCNETFLSGLALAADHERETAQRHTAEEIATAAQGNGPEAEACRATLARHEARLARALAVVIDIVDPEVIVLGGGLSRLAHLYRGLPERLGKLVFSDALTTRIVPAKHGDSSGVRGAAWLWGPALHFEFRAGSVQHFGFSRASMRSSLAFTENEP